MPLEKSRGPPHTLLNVTGRVKDVPRHPHINENFILDVHFYATGKVAWTTSSSALRGLWYHWNSSSWYPNSIQNPLSGRCLQGLLSRSQQWYVAIISRCRHTVHMKTISTFSCSPYLSLVDRVESSYWAPNAKQLGHKQRGPCRKQK
jgi:hypothetical protein